MFLSKIYEKMGSAAAVFAIVLLALVVNAPAAEPAPPRTGDAEILRLVAGKSVTIATSERIKRVSIAAPKIADITVLSSRQVYITGKAAGSTNLTIWQTGGKTTIRDIEVVSDIIGLKQRLQEILPDEKDIRVIAMPGSITLSGRVSSAANLSQAVALAEAYAPKGKVLNFLEAGGVHQVMLEVRVAEMSRSLLKRLGINFNYVRGGDFGIMSLGGLGTLDELTGGGVMEFNLADSVNALFRFHKGSATWTGLIDALKEDGLVKILAEPTLIALSGQTADFLAGGEFPVPVPEDDGTITIEYKTFGVGLSFAPIVLSKDKINITVAPEVSELDYSMSVKFGGYIVPGLTTRRASTVVELADGQSFAIAGLLKETIRDDIARYPFLSKIPVLGVLFRSRTFLKNETELVIIATPHLAKPLDMAKQTAPTDFYIEPDDMEFHLMGLMEGREKNRPRAVEGELDGDFGHAIPSFE